MIRHSRIGCARRRPGHAALRAAVATLVAVVPAVLPAQAATSQRAVRIFVPQFDIDRLSRADDQTASAAAVAVQLVRLALVQLPGAVVENSGGFRCIPSRNELIQASIAQQQSPGPLRTDQAVAYGVAGHVVADSSTIIVDIELSKCEAGMSRLLAHDKRRIPIRSALVELTEMATGVSDAVRASLPRVRVAVGPGDGAKRDTSFAQRSERAARDRLIADLGETDDFRAVAPGMPADFAVHVAVALRDTMVVGRATIKGSDSAVVSEVFESRPGRSGTLIYGSLARTIMGKLDLLSHAPGLGVGDATAADTAELRARARRALCADSAAGCRADPDFAARALRAALTVRDSRHDRALLGQAEQMLGHTDASVSAFRAALAPRAATAPTDTLSDGDQVEALRQLLAVFRSTANAASALEVYDQLLVRLPNDTLLQLDRARTLVYSGRQFDALAYLAEQAAKTGSRSLVREFEVTLRDMPPSEVARRALELQPACARDPRITAVCSEAFNRAADELGRGGGSREATRSLYSALLVLDPTAPAASRSLVELADVLVGSVSYSVPGPGRIARAAAPGSRPDSAARLLDRAEPAASRDQGLHAQLLRIRSEIEMGAGRYDRSVALARESADLRRSDAALALVGLASVLQAQSLEDAAGTGPAAERPPEALQARVRGVEALARLVNSKVTFAYVYYREAQHALGRDAEARELLRAVVQRNPEDYEARRTLAALCVDYLADYGCGFEMNKPMADMGALAEITDALNAVEAAVLAGEFKTALRWNDPLWARTPTTCFRAVSAFYEFWAASATGQRGSAEAASRRWDAAMNEATPARGRAIASGCWLFGGARARLIKASAPPNAATLRGMIDRMEGAPTRVP